ncbi:DNA primase [Mycoplasmopsis caviae]|uniref:DNA primase n=1 Tax=Mycoplasmopsis caviae TaxID=55603 RepID=A0A3P8KW50_9BACT|nr:DNA primase [Mycoplasmopsis caviae]UUD35696.1 DNA primase [Mycoplasmopsis caviae]VDR41557.1 DNA primase [Mycoplasmopsis caviae]
MSNNNHEIIKSIIANNNIVDVIGSFITLSKKGRSYVCICPFHQDTNPSMNVDEKKQIFKCFVCQVGGDVLAFLRKYKKWSLQEALEYLANKSNSNVDLSFFQKTVSYYNEEDLRIIEINNKSNSLFKLELIKRKSSTLKSFVNKRSLSNEIIQNFDIGFGDQESFKSIFANELENNADLLVKASLINSHNKALSFKDRITFAIRDERGEIVGFSARALDNETKPKYINSNETKLFKKNSLLYNWNQASEKSQDGTIIITEGFFDVIALYKAKIFNAVGLMGTALTNNHFRLLKGRKIIIFLDGDDAGQKASLKSAKFLLDHRIDTYIVNNTTKSDPDELFNDYGPENIHNLIKNAPAALDFIYQYLSRKYNLNISLDNEMKNIKAFCDDFVYYLEHQVLNIQEFYKNKIKNDYRFDIKISSKPKLPDPYDSQEIYAPPSGGSEYEDYDFSQQDVPPLLENELEYQNHVNRNNDIANYKNNTKRIPPDPDGKLINRLFYVLLNYPELNKLFRKFERNKNDDFFFAYFNDEELKHEIYKLLKEQNKLNDDILKKYIIELEKKEINVDLSGFNKNYKTKEEIETNFENVYRLAINESDKAYIEYTANEERLKIIAQDNNDEKNKSSKFYEDFSKKMRQIGKRKSSDYDVKNAYIDKGE